MSNSIFINLAAKDVAAARAFYTRLGFSINEQFSDDTNAVVVVDERISLMLVAKDSFADHVGGGREIADTSACREVGLAIQVSSREEVDRIFEAAIAAGGAQEGGVVEEEAIGMYSRGFCDLDGHKLDVLYMAA